MDGTRVGGSSSTPVTTRTPEETEDVSIQKNDSKETTKPEVKPGLPGTKDKLEDTKPPNTLDWMMKSPAQGPDPKSSNLPSFHPGVMYANPLPGAKVSGGAIALTDEQTKAKEQLEKSPAWSAISDDQKTQITKNLSKLKGDKLQQEVNNTQDRFKSIETLSNHGAWKELDSKQKEKLTGDVLKTPGSKLKQETTDLTHKLDGVATLSGNAGWKVLSPDQKKTLTEPALKLSGAQFKNHIDQSKSKLDSVASLSTEKSWSKLAATDQQRAAESILKVKDANAGKFADHLKQTTENVRGTANYVASLNDNKVDPGKTMDKLLDLEAKGPKAFPKMTAVLTDAQKQIDASANKQTAATDVRDMINFSVDRGITDRLRKDPTEAKAEIAKRFVKQYGADPSDFAKTRTVLQNNTNLRLLAHWSHSDKIGMDVQEGGSVPNTSLQKAYTAKSVPADQQTKYGHALQVLTQREGALDAINTYDSGIVSVGLRQWTTHQGSLAGPLKEFQKANPTKFQQLLPGVTINGDQILYNGKSLTEGGGKKSSDLVGGLKQSEIAELTANFHKLSKDPDFQAIQLGSAIDRIDSIRKMSVGSHKIDDYITTNRSLGHLTDFDANRPAWTKPSFEEAVKTTASDFGLKDAAPSRSELLDALKKKVEGDADYQKKLKEKYGPNILDNLKTDAGRAEFLEQRLMERYKDNFIGRENSASHKTALRSRYSETEKYYDKN